MWRCNHCEGTEFVESIVDGSQISVFNKKGKCIKRRIIALDTDTVRCNDCSNIGVVIQEIADWVNEDDVEE